MAKVRFEKTLTARGELHTVSADLLDLCYEVIGMLPDELIFTFSVNVDSTEVIARLLIEKDGADYPVGIFSGPFTCSPFQLKEQWPISYLHKNICDALRPSTVFSYITPTKSVAFTVDVEHKVIKEVASWRV